MTPRPTDSDASDDGTDADDALRRLLGDAVADVRPTDRLGEIRRRTRRRTRGSRRWLPVVAGAGVATAAVVGGVVAIGQLGNDETPPGPAASPSLDRELVNASAAYYVGDTPTGPRLFREFHTLSVRTGPGAIEQALGQVDPSGGPDDPDYRTLWPAGSFAGAAVEDDRITVELAEGAATERPAGVSEREAWLGIQQVVYTADAAIRRSLPVAFELDGAPAAEVLGVEVEELVERDRQYDVLSPVNISDPAEGRVVTGDWLYAGGTTTEAPREVYWQVEEIVPADEATGPQIGSATFGGRARAGAEGSDGPGWRARISLRGLPPGEYLLTVAVASTGQASDSPASFSDTRTFVIR